MAAGLALQAAGLAWIASVTGPDVAYGLLVPGFVLTGSGMAMVFAPAASAILGAVKPEQAGQASGATNTIREIGGVLGVAVLATVFTSNGGFVSPQAYVDGLIPAVWVGAAVLAVGALVALLVPGRRLERLEDDHRDPATVGPPLVGGVPVVVVDCLVP
jgi:MFS family permease